MLRKKIFVGVIALGACTAALANGDYAPAAPAVYTPGVYVGLQAGYGRTGWDNIDIGAIEIDGTTYAINTSSENGFAGRVFVGYDFHKNLAIEAGYTHFFNKPKITLTAGTSTSAKIDEYAIDLALKGKFEVMDDFGLFAKVGVNYLHVDDGLDLNKHGKFNVLYGAGAFYNFTPNLTADLSWTRFNGNPKLEDSYIPYADLYALGIFYKFDLG